MENKKRIDYIIYGLLLSLFTLYYALAPGLGNLLKRLLIGNSSYIYISDFIYVITIIIGLSFIIVGYKPRNLEKTNLIKYSFFISLIGFIVLVLVYFYNWMEDLGWISYYGIGSLERIPIIRNLLVILTNALSFAYVMTYLLFPIAFVLLIIYFIKYYRK